ncbi:SPOR domain-containing protein [Oceanobacillus sp. J11TS1]|uniref:SPOR domain-containing protein n=1 Tax=Oceanobacillus sp. J11TS1 TaxID=2807191 RepID=UPI001B0056B3|nr:SPOR domain-containing protein [Oceanobacillus sp. J11TS1]GIO21784.1 hypothetical protein J11TS1_03650 [Oceanobacillus sp. J11TS1]
MTKHKPHIIKNTKGTWTYKVNTSSKEDAIGRESAATVEKEQEEPNYYTELSAVKSSNKGPSMKKINKAWKAVLFSMIAAILVGSMIGFFLFRMFVHVDTPTNAETPLQGTTPAVQKEEGNKGSETVLGSLDSLEMYILQAGIFSEQANADEMITNLNRLNIPSTLIEKDGQLFLMAGVGPNEEVAKSLAASLSSNQIDLYVKEWRTEAKEIEMSDAERDWIIDFQTFFNEQLQQVDLHQSVTDEEITALVDKAPEKADTIDILVTSLTEMKGEASPYQLLNWMKVYDQL